MIVDEIKAVLEKNGYETNPEIISRIKTMIASIHDDNQLYKLDYIIEWFNKKREQSDMAVEEISINDLDKWNVDKKTGNISHVSNGFFEVIGIKVSNTFDREVGKKGWTQPIIAKNPGGILGLLMKKINGVPHFLVQAKAEPGNIGKLQLSPTLQATTSNLLKAHGGIFYLKTNYNMIVEVDENEELDIPDSFIWITLFQIKQLLKIENFVGPHIRGIISYL